MSDRRTTLILSDRLRRVLISIRTPNASQILSLEGCDLKNFPYAYIDVTTSPETLSFILSNKCDDVDDVWNNTRRTEIRCGKIFNKILGDCSTEDIEKLVNKYKANYKTLFSNAFDRFIVVDGADIKKFYNARTNIGNDNTLGKSCMRYDDCGKWLNIYVKNPQTVKMLILMDAQYKNRISGRALLWELSDGRKFMDRIYYAYDSDRNLFIEYAKKNGWLYRYKQKIDDLTICDAAGNNLGETRVQATIRRFKYKHFPFVDTLRYYHKGVLANWMFNDSCIELRDGHGNYIDPNSMRIKLKRELSESSLEYIYDMYGERHIFENFSHRNWIDHYVQNKANRLAKTFMTDEHDFYTKSSLVDRVRGLASIQSLRDYNSVIRDILNSKKISNKSQLDTLEINELKQILVEVNYAATYIKERIIHKYQDLSVRDILVEKYGEINSDALSEIRDHLDWGRMISRIIDEVTRNEEPTVFDEGPYEEEPADVPVRWDDSDDDDMDDDVDEEGEYRSSSSSRRRSRPTPSPWMERIQSQVVIDDDPWTFTPEQIESTPTIRSGEARAEITQDGRVVVRRYPDGRFVIPPGHQEGRPVNPSEPIGVVTETPLTPDNSVIVDTNDDVTSRIVWDAVPFEDLRSTLETYISARPSSRPLFSDRAWVDYVNTYGSLGGLFQGTSNTSDEQDTSSPPPTEI